MCIQMYVYDIHGCYCYWTIHFDCATNNPSRFFLDARADDLLIPEDPELSEFERRHGQAAIQVVPYLESRIEILE